MTDEGQLDFDGLLGEEPEAKKPARKRRPGKPKEKPEDLPAPDPTPAPETPVEDTMPVREPAEGEAAPELVADLEPATGLDPEPVAEPELEAPPKVPVETEPIVEGEETAPAKPAPPRLFFLTNRMNLNGVLSSRLLAPREAFHKYYTDLLELAPGWVPILTGPPPVALVERVVAERGAGAPVLVELSESVLSGQQPDGRVAYLRAALLSDVKAVHFREEKSRREHRARGYSNVHPHEDLLQVSPELFASESDTEVFVAAPDDTTATDWLQLDRVRGAVSAALAASDSGEALAVAAGVLGAPNLPKDTVLPPWLTWHGLIGEAVVPATEGGAELADRLIFQAAYRVLGERDQSESWSPSEVLESVTAEIAAAEPSDEVIVIVERNLQRVRELVNVELDFEPFRNPGSRYVAAKSFLMVLLRPDLEQLLEWPTEETGADETTRVVAAILAGRLRGVARESVKLRSITLDDLSAAWALRAANGDASSFGPAEFGADETKTALLVNGVELRTSAPLIPDPVPLYEALNAGARQVARIAVSRRLEWPVDVRVHVPADSKVQAGESVISITSTESVKVETVVDEPQFIERLRDARGTAKSVAVGTLNE